jgi:hypothetical protein
LLHLPEPSASPVFVHLSQESQLSSLQVDVLEPWSQATVFEQDQAPHQWLFLLLDMLH